MKELKEIKWQHTRTVTVLRVESGEGIESCSTATPGQLNPIRVESGEGIESMTVLSEFDRFSASWNPVKELKDLSDVLVNRVRLQVESGEGIESR